MNHDDVNNSLSFGQLLDDQTHQQIKQLDEKLKKLLINIDAKKTSLSQTGSAASDETLQQLTTLQMEVEKALIGIEVLVSIAVTDSVDGVEFTSQEHNQLAELREMLLDNTLKITEIEEKFIL